MIEIENKQFLIDRFGRWPSFHDAEVVRVRFEREGPDAPFMECDIHVFDMTDDVDGSGHYDLKHHTPVTVRFCSIGLESFKWWNHQNAISGIHISPVESGGPNDREEWPIEAEIPSSYGCGAKLLSKAV